jgi:molecular chaperone GrpE (heat shock protein)
MQASQQMIANLQAQLARLQRVEGELRQQLQNGRERAAREIAAGNTPNPHGLGKEILPRMIQDTISASNAVAEQLSKLKKD